MLRIPSLSPDQQRELRLWRSGDEPPLARRAQFILWSARGWSVPALAHAMGCCRRAVRRWLHAFLDAGLVGLLGRSPESRESRQGPSSHSAVGWGSSAAADRLVRVVPSRSPNSGASSSSTG